MTQQLALLEGQSKSYWPTRGKTETITKSLLMTCWICVCSLGMSSEYFLLFLHSKLGVSYDISDGIFLQSPLPFSFGHLWDPLLSLDTGLSPATWASILGID